MNFIIGRIKYKSTVNTSVGRCTNLYVSVYTTTTPELFGNVKVVAWESQSLAAEKMNRNQLVMVEFREIRKEFYKGKEILKITAKRITKSNTRELEIHQKNEDGQHDPFRLGGK